jgi:hypothetical protein
MEPNGTQHQDARVWKRFGSLKKLYLHTSATDDDVKALAPLTTLTYLGIRYCDGVSDVGVKALAALTSLTNLDMRLCRGVTEEGVFIAVVLF